MSWKSVIAVGAIVATIGCKKEEPPPAPERVPALRDMNPDQIEAVIALTKMAARQEVESEGLDIDAFLAHEHVELSPLLFEVSEPDPLLSVPPRELPAEDVELAALIDECPKDENTRRAVALLEGLAQEAVARGLRFDRLDPVTVAVIADAIATLETTALEAVLERLAGWARSYLATARAGERIDFDEMTGRLLLEAERAADR